MAKPPRNRRMLVEDYPADQQQWIGKLLQILNQFMDETTFALSNNVSLTENAYVQVKTLNFKGNSSILGTISSGSNSITNASSTYDLITGMSITGDGIPVNTTITNIVGTTITISNNATKTITGVPLIVGSNFPLNFQYTLSGNPIGMHILDIYENVNNPLPIATGVNINWEYINGQIIIRHISGLRANIDYTATFLVYGS